MRKNNAMEAVFVIYWESSEEKTGEESVNNKLGAKIRVLNRETARKMGVLRELAGIFHGD